MPVSALFANEFILVTAKLDRLTFFWKLVRILFVKFHCVRAADITFLSIRLLEAWRLDKQTDLCILHDFYVILHFVRN